ncbi:MAG: hypothetical protein F6K09_29420 [Merismopedia sp. SIO2A8]|nr:hypothetical protein [Symploca sp. SIO2B6]NET52649.1 hypothetical protein [Merismopedia sp. SIO2A8]
MPTPHIIQVDSIQNLPGIVDNLDLGQDRPTMVLVGGASKVSPEDFERIRLLFFEVLAPLAEELGLTIVDGGTDAGIMQLIGQARAKMSGTFPLIGVAPKGLVDLPNQPAPCPDSAPIEQHHTHCILIPGSEWGDESPWIAQVATLVAKGQPSVAVLINGGEVTWKDAQANVDLQRPVVVIAGSGRTADVLAEALLGLSVTDQRAQPLVKSGLLQRMDLKQPMTTLAHQLKGLFCTEVSSV